MNDSQKNQNESIHHCLNMRNQHISHSNERQQRHRSIVLLLINSEDL
jgi:hypothetical protein